MYTTDVLIIRIITDKNSDKSPAKFFIKNPTSKNNRQIEHIVKSNKLESLRKYSFHPYMTTLQEI